MAYSTIQCKAMLPKIKIANCWLLLLLLQLLLLLSESDGLLALTIPQRPVRSQQRHPMRKNHEHNIVQTQWILNRYSVLKLIQEDDSADVVELGTSRAMNNSHIHDFIGHPLLPLQQNHYSIDNFIQAKASSSLSDRRNVLQQLSQTAILTVSTTSTILSSPIGNHPIIANAATTTTTTTTATNTMQLQSTPMRNNNNKNYISADTAKMTHQVFFNVRISRPDGTFYIRDDEEDDSMVEPENRVYYGQLIFGLFGNNAPHHVQRFLEYIIDPTTTTTTTPSSSTLNNNEEAPYPSYSRSSFTQFDDATGLLYGGTIPSMEIVEIQQSVALRYGNRLLPAKLWVEDATTTATGIPNKISHDRIGLLTHEQFDATPVFGITTRNDTTALNPTHTVFGALIMNADAKAFLQRISTIPTYSIDRPIVQPQSTLSSSIHLMDEHRMDGATSPSTIIVPQDTMMSTMRPATDAIYNLQREFFRNTAKTLGDTRINKLYNGKLLRRVEVTQVGVLQ